MVHELNTLLVIGAGLVLAGAGFYYLMGADNSPELQVGTSRAPMSTWPMQRADPNITNAYNRAAYRDNTLRADEIYANPATNFTNDFLSTYAPTVKQMQIPIQQL